MALSILPFGSVVPVRAVDPPIAAYDVTNIGATFGPLSEFGLVDMNAAHQVSGVANSNAFWYDGTTSSYLFPVLGHSGAGPINSSGAIAGAATNNGNQEAYVFDGSPRFIGTLGGSTSRATDINDAGDVVGTAQVATGEERAFLYRNGVMSEVPTPGGTGAVAMAINDVGTVTGYYYSGAFTGSSRAFVWDGVTSTDLGTLGGPSTTPIAINDSGEIVGNSSTPTQADVAFLYAGGAMTSIAPPGSTSSSAVGINERGLVIGSYSDPSSNNRAFIYDHGTFTLIPEMGGSYVTVSDINERGQVIGVASTGFDYRGYLFDNGNLVDLTAQIPLGYESMVRYAITIGDDGTILAGGLTVDGRDRALLLVPTTPLPPFVPPATPGHPVSAAVTSPVAGQVTITESATTDPPPIGSGYSFLGHQLNIAAPSSTSADPLTIVLAVDAGLLASADPDLTADDVVVFRDGVPVDPCSTSAADDPATPDPCVSRRETLSGGVDAGDARITVLTSAASHWNVGSISAATAPAAPSGVAATRGNLQALVAWTAPDDGGSPITSYLVTSSPGAKTATALGSETSTVVTGLTNGTAYTFSVTATNAVATGAASPPSNAVTPGPLLTQSITFVKPSNSTMLQSPVGLDAKASSLLPVTLMSTTLSVCTVAGAQATLLAPGTCSITATQPGNITYKPASAITKSFAVTKGPQTITFTKPANSTMIQSPVSLVATVNSPLPVTLTSTTQSVCSVAGAQATLLTSGTCSITATQPGDNLYAAASAVSKSFAVTRAPQTITIPDPGPQSLLVPTVVLTPFASSGLPVTLSSQTPAVCTVSGDTVTLKKAGTCKVKGVQAGDTTYAAATAVVLSLAINASTSMAYVVASGDGLRIAGQPFRLNGASIYGTSNPGAPVDPRTTVAMAMRGDLNSLRLVNVFDERGLDTNAPFAEADWRRVDALIARARGAGLRVVLDVSAFRNHLVNRDIRGHGWEANCQPGADRSPVDYTAIDPYRPGLDSEWRTFLDFVTNRVNTVNGVRYGADATIAVISVAGEPQPPASEECGKATSTADLTDFYVRTLGYLASIDGNHLRSNGGLIHTDWEQLYGGPSGIDGGAIFALAANTLPSVHTYPGRYAADGTPIDYQTPVLGPVATGLGKPWFTEEFGWTQSVGDATRAGFYHWVYAEQTAYGSAGAMFWNLGPESAGGSHDVNPGTPLTWTEVLAQ